MKHAGKAMRERRESLGLSVRDVGRMLDVSEVTIYSWQSEHAEPSLHYRQEAYKQGLLPLGALTGNDADWETYLTEPAA